mgnify:CR=1 FL=1
MNKADCVVIGAGVIGLAIGRSLSLTGRDVLVLEENEHIGMVTSSRNSEVIHAGIYYPENSLKAKFCVHGRKIIYDFLCNYNIDYKKLGKLIIATEEKELETLKLLEKNAKENGVNLTYLHAKDVRRLEPEINCVGSLLSEESGIFDSHSFMMAIHSDIEKNGGTVVKKCKVKGGEFIKNGIVVNIDDKEKSKIICNTVVNCSGLGAYKLSNNFIGIKKEGIPKIFYAKGNYFYLNKKAPFKRLVYPLPGKHSLGIHFTPDLSGKGRFGPDIEWIDNVDYNVDNGRLESFYLDIKKYWPKIKKDMLSPGYAGIRTKVSKEKVSDFIIHTPKETGQRNFYSLYGIDSPGLTSSLSIAEYVAKIINDS